MTERKTLDIPVSLIEDIRIFQESMVNKYSYHCHVYVKDRDLTIGVPKTNLRRLWNHICDIAYEEHNLDLDGNRELRFRMYVTYRQIYAYIARKKGYSLQAIGRIIGKDHATILNNVRKFKTLRSINDPELMPVYNIVVEQLKVRINASDIEPSNTNAVTNEPSTLLISH